jgi:putative peptidoglycan lipid II flippase
MRSENSRVVKAAGVVGSATLLSRVLGFIRDAVIAWYFGAGLSTDVFIAAFRIPNLFRKLFGEGSLSNAFVPVFTEYYVRQGKEEAFRMARSALRLLSVLLAVVSIAGVLLAPVIVRVIAPGFSDSPDKLWLTAILTRMMFPYIFFICLVALCMGILNVLGHFAAPALAPVLLNLAMIGAVFFISPHLDRPVFGLAVGVVIGGVMQLLLQLPFLIRKGLLFWQKADMIHPGLKKVGKLMPPIVLGGAVYQINILIGTLLASLLKQGSVSYLYFADRLVQFPLGIFAIATATAVLPSLSRQASAGDFEALKQTFAYAFKMTLFITIPAMAGLIVLREPIVALLFQRGKFDAAATRLTAYALLYYAIGLWAFSAVRIVVAAFFAMQDTRTPVKTAVISVIANTVLGVILMRPMAHGGLALATSIASMINLVLLVGALRAKLGSLGWKSIGQSVLRTLACSGIMGLVVWMVAVAVIPVDHRTLPGLVFGLTVSIAAGLLTYGGIAFVIRSPELINVLVEAKNNFKTR